jgi:hypothetical protein
VGICVCYMFLYCGKLWYSSVFKPAYRQRVCVCVCECAWLIFFIFWFVGVLWVKAMINQTRQQTNYCLGLASQSSKKGNGSIYNCYNTNNREEDDAVEKMRKDIEANQDNALILCTEKVLLARQAYELVSFSYSKAFLINCFLQHVKFILYGSRWFIKSLLGSEVVGNMFLK